MLYREIIAVCSQIHTKHINTLCGQDVELYMKNQSRRKQLIETDAEGVCYHVCHSYGLS